MNVSDTKTDLTEKYFLYNFFFNFVPTLLLLQTADLGIFWLKIKNFKTTKHTKLFLTEETT